MTSPRRIGWDSLFLTGSVVDLDVAIWQGRTRLRPEDLGIEDSTEVHRALSLGCTRLIPKEALNNIREIASRAKRIVESNSLVFPAIRGARYVPVNKFEPMIVALKECQEEFNAGAEAFISGLEQTKAENFPIIKKALVDAAKTPEAAEAAYNRLVAEYPAEDVIRRKFFIRWIVYAMKSASTAEVAGVAEAEAESVKGIVRSMIEQNRGEFAEKVGAITAAVARGGKIPIFTINSAREALDRMDSMNVMDDRVLADMVARLRRVIDQAERDGGGAANSGLLNELNTIRQSIDATADQAVADAEAALTGVGRRQFTSVAEEGVA